MGRTVPWICWQEWFLVRDWLLSSARADIQRGIQRVRSGLMNVGSRPGQLLGVQTPLPAAHAAAAAAAANSCCCCCSGRRCTMQVEAWRARGRVPLGVDVTASLLETALCDASFWAPPAAAAAQSTTPAAGRGSSMSHQQLRLQYAATIVRCVCVCVICLKSPFTSS
jgi:hypothetical protein